MWETDSLWFEVAITSMVIALGHILLGHFEERTPRVRKLVKYLLSLIVVIGLSLYFGRTVAFTVYALLFIPVLYIHIVMLPRKGINGWTGEPKSKYYEYRGWDKDIFKSEEQNK
ncbi:MAG: hypothetical protein KF845_14735 [Cyclobacteriaceae bacterium]|nr:hypothetical protein [Cyclobacteriaceae bacterium]